MSYQSLSAADLLAITNAANSTSFTLADVDFGTPQVLSGTWQGNTTTKNTGVKITAKAGGSYQGKQSVAFDRLKLNDLAAVNFPGLTLTGYGVTSAHGLIPWLSYWNGLHFTTDDIEDSALTDNGDGTRTVTLTAKAGSLGWYGSVALTVKSGGAALNTLVTNTDLNGLNYPTASDQDTYAQMYMYPYDFTPYFNTLALLNAGQVNAGTVTDLANAFKAVDLSSGKTLWNGSEVSTAWSLVGASVVSNGLNNTGLPTNPAYKYVCVIQLRPDVTIPAGYLYLHYNDPYNPDA